MRLHALFRQWRQAPKRAASARIRLPWWGQILSTQDKRVLEALIQSGLKMAETVQTPGWADIESVFQDWLERYRDLAGRLGQEMKEQRGQLVLTEDDTTADDRRRLIACAQAAAIRGLLSEIKTRAKAADMIGKRDHATQEQETSGELL